MRLRVTLVLTAAILFSLVVQAQRSVTGEPLASKLYRDAEFALLNHDYKKSLRLFEKVLKEYPDLAAAHRGMGVANELLNDYQQAAYHYTKVIELDSLFSRLVYYQAGEALYKNGMPDSALTYFEKFKAMQSLDSEEFAYHFEKEEEQEKDARRKLEANIRACKVSLDSAKFQNIKEVINLGSAINTSSDEYFPCLTNDQQMMFYTRRKNNQADEDLYVSTFENGEWKNGNPWGPFNTNKNEGMPTLVRNGRRLFFTACNREGVLGTCDIWEADIEHLKIKYMGPLDGYSNSERWESQAAISCDGSTLYFASNREGGFGGTDLWSSRRLPNGLWSDPVNLGPKINTDLDEESPFITNDGKTLYFSSTGHVGMGEQDIFISWLDDLQQWSVPINLGPPVNTPYRELGFFLSADGQTGYFASNRQGGMGGMDIYKFQLSHELFSDPITFVEGIVRDSLTDLPVESTVLITGRDPIKTDPLGRFFLCVPAEKTLDIRVEEPGYHPYRQIFGIPVWDNRKSYSLDIVVNPVRDLSLRGVPEPDTIAAESPKMIEQTYNCLLYFDFDSYKLNIKEMDHLDEFMRSLKDKDIQRVEIIGFADDIGTDAYNLQLSEERAKQIALFLRDYGIIVHKVYVQGRGEIKDDNPKNRNRRVEVKVTTVEQG